MAGRLTKTQLKKHLAHLEQKELVEELAKLFTNFKEVKQYYQMKYNPDTDYKAFLESYKEKLEKKFYTKIGIPLYPSAATLRKLITEFKKFSASKYDLVELTLYRVELAVEFSNRFRNVDESFYKATLNAYHDAIKLIVKEKLENEFKDIALKLVKDTNSDTNWSLYDAMKNVYTEIYSEFE